MSPLARSLFLPFVIACVAGPVLLFVLAIWLQGSERDELLRSMQKQRLLDLARTILTTGPEEDMARSASSENRVRIEFVNPATGKVEFDSGDANTEPGARVGVDVSSEPDVYLATTSESGSVRRLIDGQWVTFATVQASQADPTASKELIVRVSSPTYLIPGRFQLVSSSGGLATSAVFWTLSFFVVIVSAVAGTMIARNQHVPIQHLSNSIQNIEHLVANGDEEQVPPGSAETVTLRDLSHICREALIALRVEFQRQQQQRTDLESTARFLDTVLGAMIEGVIVVDRDHQVVYANKAASQLLSDSLRPDEMKGRQLLEIVRHKSIDQSLRQVLSEKQRVRSEFELPRSQMTVSLVATRLIQDQEPAAVLVFHDVTELRRLENVRREFVSNVSHELKTPLASIQAYVESLLDGAMNDPQTNHRFLTRIEEQSERLNELIQDILHLARIESGKEAFDFRDVSVSRMVATCVNDRQAMADSKSITVEVDQPVSDLKVRADTGGLRVIIDNLISNAIKYTPANGCVSIRWSIDDEDIRIDIADSGPGIARAHLPRIFERFYRTDEARSRDIGGTGLGLAIVKHLTQVFGGRINVESELGDGSCFTVHLPRA